MAQTLLFGTLYTYLLHSRGTNTFIIIIQKDVEIFWDK